MLRVEELENLAGKRVEIVKRVVEEPEGEGEEADGELHEVEERGKRFFFFW